MSANYMNVLVIIFSLTTLNCKTPITVATVVLEEMVGMGMVMVEKSVTMEEAVMESVETAPLIAVPVPINICLLGNIFILLIRIYPLIFL